MKVEVNYEVVKAAFWNWFNYHDMTYGPAVKSFLAFTGLTSFLERHIVTEEQATRIKLLAGPHHHTLLKAHYAKEAD